MYILVLQHWLCHYKNNVPGLVGACATARLSSATRPRLPRPQLRQPAPHMLWLVLLLLLRAVPRATAVNATHIVVGVTAPVATAARALAGLNVALLEANDAGGAMAGRPLSRSVWS